MSDAAAPNIDVIIQGQSDPIADAHVLSLTVDRDMGSADMAAVLLANQDDIYSTLEIGSSLEIKVGSGTPVSIYKGEIVGLEPIYKGGDKSKILIRAMNRFHRLLRKRKSRTWTDKSDKDILTTVIGDVPNLKLEWKHETKESIKPKHVYQHNQTDMEFLRTRAARMGCHVWCVDSTVFVKQPELQGEGKIKLNVDTADAKGGPTLRMFAPRLSSAGIVKKVTVKGWNPETKELITGVAEVTSSKLGKDTSVVGSKDHGTEETFTVDHPIWSPEEATALAKARLQEASLTYITGVAETSGTSAFELGELVSITANQKGTTDPFNGTYYIMGLTHRFNASHAKDDSAYVTVLKLARDAQKATK